MMHADPYMHTSYRKVKGRHEHRVVMERLLGRRLSSEEIVHHKDGTKRNNVPENLVLTDRVEHARIHNCGKRRVPKRKCKFGHALEGENVCITWAGRRRCVTCQRAYDAKWKRDKRASQPKRPHGLLGKPKSPEHRAKLIAAIHARSAARKAANQVDTSGTVGIVMEDGSARVASVEAAPKRRRTAVGA